MESDGLEAVLCFRGAFFRALSSRQMVLPVCRAFFPSARIKSLLKQGEKNIKIEAHEVEICFDFKQGQTQRTPQPPEKH